MAMRQVGVAELKNNLSRHLRAVEAGEALEVTDHDRPIARLVPVEPRSRIIIQEPTRPFAEIRGKVHPPRTDASVDYVELLLEDRRKR